MSLKCYLPATDWEEIAERRIHTGEALVQISVCDADIHKQRVYHCLAQFGWTASEQCPHGYSVHSAAAVNTPTAIRLIDDWRYRLLYSYNSGGSTKAHCLEAFFSSSNVSVLHYYKCASIKQHYLGLTYTSLLHVYCKRMYSQPM